MTAQVRPPVAARRPVRETRHGFLRRDDYQWLRCADWPAVMRSPDSLEPDVRAFLNAENTHTDAVMADSAALQEALFTEMTGRLKEDDSSVPSPDGPWLYYMRQVTGGQHPLVCRRRKDGAEEPERQDETILLDGNGESTKHDYFRLGGWTHAPDHSLLAWSADTLGSEYFTVRLRTCNGDGGDLDDRIPDTAGMVWAADSRTIFYVRVDENHRPNRVFRHRVGEPVERDVLVHEETDPGFFVTLDKTLSGDFIIIAAHDHTTSESWLVDSAAPETPPRLVAPRDSGVEYFLDHDRDRNRFIILCNTDGAEDFKLVTAPCDSPERENWRDLVGHQSGRLILFHACYRNHLVRLERSAGLPRIVVRSLSQKTEHAIAFDEEAYDLALAPGHEYDTSDTRFTYSSMTTPAHVYDYDMDSQDRRLRKIQEIPSGHDPALYVTGRMTAPAADGEEIPISLLRHIDTPLDGSAPLLLYGYGAYGITIPAGFSITRLSLVDRGFIYAIAHVRGGKACGHRWFTEGRGAKKINTFRDFIAAGEHLAASGLTARGNITAHGGSAGGLLMGAAANMAPDLFRGIIAEVPFVDALATMLDASLPLTPPEWPEWGNPITDPKAYETIASWSPVDNVSRQAYPHILATAGLTDPRVGYWEPAKWVARLRDLNTSDALILLKTHMGAGHGGAPGRLDHLKETAFLYAFALMIHGLTDAPLRRSR